MNRSWNIATEFSHPTIMATKKLLHELDSSDVSEEHNLMQGEAVVSLNSDLLDFSQFCPRIYVILWMKN